jgi:hypothetical protein
MITWNSEGQVDVRAISAVGQVVPVALPLILTQRLEVAANCHTGCGDDQDYGVNASKFSQSARK